MGAKTFRSWVAVGWLVLSAAAHAHHSPAMFDPSKQLTLTGTVRLFQWTNPHSPLRSGKPGGLLVEARTADGKSLGANP